MPGAASNLSEKVQMQSETKFRYLKHCLIAAVLPVSPLRAQSRERVPRSLAMPVALPTRVRRRRLSKETVASAAEL